MTAAAFFNNSVRLAFVGAVAATLNIAPSSIAITNVSTVAASRRHLAQTGTPVTEVDFQMFLIGSAAASSVASRLAATGGPTLAALRSAGLPVTGVVLSRLPSVPQQISTPPSPPSPAPPPPTPPPPAGCGITWSCFAGVSCAGTSNCGPCPTGLVGDGRSCAGCTLRSTIAPSLEAGATTLSTGLLARSVDAMLSGVVSVAESACNISGGFSFSWSSNATASSGTALSVASVTASTLALPARSLASGQRASFTMHACFIQAPSACTDASVAYDIVSSPLVALINGGVSVVGELPLLLSAASSYDPDGAPLSSMTFNWTCTRLDGTNPACAARNGQLFAPSASVTQTLQLAGASGGAMYVITLVVSLGARSSTATTSFTVQPGELPLVEIAPSAVLSGEKATPSVQQVLLANATSFVPGAVSTRWTLVESTAPGPLLNLSDPNVCSTPVTSISLVLRPGVLLAGYRYTFTLSATDAVGAVGSANATITTAAPPRDGWVDVSPASGIALSTPFALTAAGWTADADELPLSYYADYVVEGSSSPPMSLTGGAFQASPSFRVLLPAGVSAGGNVVTLRLTVRSKYGATASSNASALVTWPVFASTAAVNTFVGDATARATASLQSGDSSSALQMVSGLATLLNADVTNSMGSARSSNGTSAGYAAAVMAAVAAAATQRANLLSLVASAVSSNSMAMAAPAALESTAALVSQLVSMPAQMTPAGTASALAALGSIARAGTAVSPAAAQSVALALSSVVLTVVAGPATGAASSGGNSTAAGSNTTSGGSHRNNDYTAVLGVLDSLANSQKSGMVVPGQAPATVSTSAIQMAVSLEDGSSPSSRLFSAPLSAPGSNSSFDPLPPTALSAAGGAPLSMLFLSLAFDAHVGAGSSNTGGMTRLAFSSATTGAVVHIANLTQPILFTEPSSNLATGQQSSCRWWDDALDEYTSIGCATLPSPRPPGHDLTFQPGFQATSAASLTTAWSISGPLLAGCKVQFLDCTNATMRGALLQLNPSAPRSAPVMTCDNATDVVLRAYVGEQCQLRNATGNATCIWDALNQTFAGLGCVPAEKTRCACSHLTDFTSSPAPNVPMCSLSDLLSLNPADLISKLRLLFTVVCALFGALNIGAGVGMYMDRGERTRVARRLQDPSCGFRISSSGAWLWRFGLDPLPDELAPPSGPAIHLSMVLGLPFARLRAALPDELFKTDLAAALGRRHGFSASGMARASQLHRELLRGNSKRQSFGTSRQSTRTAALLFKAAEADDAMQAAEDAPAAARKSDTNLALAATDVPPVHGAPDEPQAATWKASTDLETALEELVGTALVLAYLQVAQLLPVVEIARRRGAAVAYFDGLTTPAGWSFDVTATSFVTMLSPGVLNMRSRYFVRCRLWKLILSQSTQGFWDATSSVAFALEARSLAEIDQLKSTWFNRLKDKLEGIRHVIEDVLGEGGTADVSRILHDSTTQDMTGDSAPAPRRSSMRRDSMYETAQDVDTSDDPVWCSPRAVLAAMPRRLAALHRGDVQVDRVWTTMCCIAFLERLNVSWYWGDGDSYPDVERTIVDAGREWLEAHAAEQPELAAALADGVLAEVATQTVVQWHRAWERRVDELRRSEAVTSHATTTQVHRSGAEIIRAICTKHDTLSVFLSAPLDGLQRWQTWMLIVTTVLNQLLVSIWYWAKGVNCCAEVQLLLGCPPTGPCRGVEANCGDLAGLFAATPVPPYFPNGLADYTCHAFPDDASQRDSFIVALIALAVAVPVTYFLGSCFEIANDNEAPESWMMWSGPVRLLCGFHAHRRWHYTRGAQPRRFVRWYCRSADAPKPETLGNLYESLVAWLTRTKPPWTVEAEAAAAEAAAAAAPGASPLERGSDSHSVVSSVPSAVALMRRKRVMTIMGVSGVYLIWAIFSWFIFTYGMLIYKLLGDSAQSSFASSFGVSYAVGAASEWQDIAKETAKGLIILAVLERLHITRPLSWLEDHLDYLSVQALLFRENGRLNAFQASKLIYSFRRRIGDA